VVDTSEALGVIGCRWIVFSIAMSVCVEHDSMWLAFILLLALDPWLIFFAIRVWEFVVCCCFVVTKQKRLKYSHERRYNTGGCMSISGISFAHIQPVSL